MSMASPVDDCPTTNDGGLTSSSLLSRCCMIHLCLDSARIRERLEDIQRIQEYILADDRFVWDSIASSTAMGIDSDEKENSRGYERDTQSMDHHPHQRICFLHRSSRASRFCKENAVSQLIENESIPQYLWPAAAPFAAWISHHPHMFHGLTVLELGSGVGLCGLAAAACGARLVVLSDFSVVSLSMLGCTIAKNEHENRFPVDTVVKAAHLKWGDEEALSAIFDVCKIAHFDVVIGSDIFYFQNALSCGLKSARQALLGGGVKPGDERAFICSSVVRSERMDDEIDVVPQTDFFHGGVERLQCSDDNTGLRVYRWLL